MNRQRTRWLSFLLAVMMTLTMLPPVPLTVRAAENSLEGKTISILGASISTFAGTSNGAAADTTNSTIRGNAKYYPSSAVTDVTLPDTWWMQAAEDLGLRLLVNNSWSGSSLLHTRNGTVGAYVDRCVQLHDDTGDNAGEEPDIIAIQMGTNDFQYFKDTLGTADIDYAALITENGGVYTYAEPVTSLEAAAIVLHKISVRYPGAEVYYLNISQRVDGTDALIRAFNAELKQVVEHFGAHIVDIYGSAITMDSFPTHIGDGRVHPNRLGMDAYTEAFKRALLEHTAYTVDTHTVSLALDGVTADYGDDKIVVDGDSFTVTLTAPDSLRGTVTMGGQDLTKTAYADGVVTIESVTDDVVITASSVFEPHTYRWEFDGEELACVSGGNALTKNGGTTTDGVFSGTRYALQTDVVLRHDQSWSVEWKSEGSWRNSASSSGGRLFTESDVNADYNVRYIFKSAVNGLIAMGEKTSSGSHNYGVALSDYGIDGDALHTYRLENRVASDGSNMVWLWVDGVEIAPLNHYYIGTKDQKTTSDWLSGKDFVFPYIGTDTHGFTNASIGYIQVWEGSHSHTYENGTCTGCGATASPYLQHLPENTIGCTNLYDSLAPVKGYYTATKYDTSNGAVLSVVIPVEPGDRIAASSFGPVSENMGSVDGIRVTYLLGDEIVTSLSAGEVYNGYTNNGYITVPDGVDAVCVPWWKPSDSNWLTLSQLSKDFAVHSPKTVAAQAPTCTENGYTAGEICEVCGASLGERAEIPPIGHTYSGDTCTICGAVNMAAILGGQYVSILGDSISTFNGYSNDSTVNSTIGGNGPRYDEGTADTKPGSYCLLESVNDTWWMHFANRSGMKLLVNNSWAGSQVFGGQTSDGRVIPAAYLDRCVNLHDNTLENNPGNEPINPDVIFVYLGINDYNFNRSQVGTDAVNYAGLVSSNGAYAAPETFGEAYGIMLHKMRRAYPDAQIFAMTLLPENLYSVDKPAWEQHNAYIRAAAEYHNIPVVDLARNCAITWENYSGYMIDKIHPTTAGMELISDCIEAELAAYYQENPPHTHAYTSAVTAPTCTEQGYTTYTCACGDNYTDDYTDVLSHIWASWQQIAEENCQGLGRWMRSCETCAAEQYTTDQDGSCVSFNSPAILANAGDTVVLSYYDVALGTDTVADAASVIWSSDQLMIDQGCVTPAEPGVYPLTATSGTVSKTIYLVVKAPEDTEYVLYFDDFTDAALPGYRPIEVPHGAQYYVSDGKLILDASNSASSYIRLLLPEWIGDFGDYEINTTFTMTEALDSTKWFAVMARVQDEDCPYLQAPVRFNAAAANGIELDQKNEDNSWVILHKTSYTEAISPSKYYTQTFGLSGTTGCHAINGTTLLESDLMAYGPGGVGFQVRGAAASVDSIQIVIPVDTANHTLGDWTVTTAPTCTEPGTETRSCSVCGYTEVREIDPCHDLVQYEEKMHTCTESGWLAYETCTRCDYSTLAEVAPTGHSYQRQIHAIAHRGYSQTAPENTLAAYKLAKDKGYIYVECDVAITADGIPVLLHDETIDRTSDGTGKISELTYEQLLQYDFGSWKSADYAGTTIPTFEEFIALCVGLDLHPYIELKKNGSYTQAKVQQLVDIVEAYGMTDKATWISYSNTFLGYVKNAAPTARLGYIYSSDATESVLNTAKKLRTGQNEVFLCLNYSKITNTGTLRAATNGFAIEVWTVNSKSAILALPAYVSGVISDKLHAQSILVDDGITITAPTCTDKGFTTHTCTACGNSFVDDYVDALGHRFSEWKVTTAPTCTKSGQERRDCENCDHYETREVAATGHDYESVVTEPTCTNKGYTTHTCACGDSYVDSWVDALGHSFGEWKVTTAPTCTKPGQEQRNCENCDHYETREIAATGHDFESVVTNPTCTTKGYTTHTCTACGNSFVDDYVDALGHRFSEWKMTTAPSCTEPGQERRYCENCDHYETREVAATGHDYKSVVTEPTCTEKGFTIHTCACGDSFVDTWVDALGHSWGEWEVIQEPTAAAPGLRQRTCGNCGEAEQEEIPQQEIIYGDANGDGRINSLDVILLRQYLADWDVTLDTAAADANGDGRINSLDVIRLRQYLADWDVTLGPQ